MVVASTNRLREDRDRFVGFTFAHADLLVQLDMDGRVIWADGALRSLLGVEAEELIGAPFAKVVAGTDVVLLKAALRQLNPGQRRRDVPLTLIGTKGAPVSALVSINRSLQQSGQGYYVAIVVRPPDAATAGASDGIPARDRVSGLVEAAQFTQTAMNAFNQARQSGKSTSLTLLEICQGEELNRLLGPDRAEALTAEIGAQLKLHALDYDSAAHVGDGKFSVAHFTDESPASIVEAIASIGESYDLDAATLNLSRRTVDFPDSSLGDDDVAGILSYVIERFSRDGSEGMAEGVSAQDYLRKKTAETLSRVVAMRDLIHEQRITLHYQPIVSLPDRSVHHYEVLLRFADGRSPFEDVKFAEEINIIHELDLAVTQGAIRRIEEAAEKQHNLELAVNMSARSLLNDNFIGMFDQLARRLEKKRGNLIVEITESAKLDDLPKAAQAVDHLRSQGHAVCLDDFGAGASSLPYLQQLMVDYVKIDGVYIRSITESLRERAIVQGVLTTCRCLGIKSVAEMIEKEDQHKCLADLGVDYGQGWLYGRPFSEIPPPVATGATRLRRRQGSKEMWS